MGRFESTDLALQADLTCKLGALWPFQMETQLLPALRFIAPSVRLRLSRLYLHSRGRVPDSHGAEPEQIGGDGCGAKPHTKRMRAFLCLRGSARTGNPPTRRHC